MQLNAQMTRQGSVPAMMAQQSRMAARQLGVQAAPILRHQLAPRKAMQTARPSIRRAIVASSSGQEHFDPQVCVVLGTQWGDEGKGKLVDILAQQYEIVARAQVSTSISTKIKCRNPSMRCLVTVCCSTTLFLTVPPACFFPTGWCQCWPHHL